MIDLKTGGGLQLSDDSLVRSENIANCANNYGQATRYQAHKKRNRRSSVILALSALSVLPLTGCMSSGAGVDETLSTASIERSAAPINTAYGYGNAGINDPYGAPQTPEDLAQLRIPGLTKTIKHGVCKGGWAVQPKKLDAKNVRPGDPYYIEMRMRQTPPLPIGHTYIAYGRLDENGKKLDEKLIMLAPIGGYVGAGAAGAIPMPGLLTPTTLDCRIRPTAAYRKSLTAVEYEKLLKEVKKAKIERPSYHLFTNNCNHFASRIAASVGIKHPKNRYTAALKYIYDVIEENEGIRVNRFAMK